MRSSSPILLAFVIPLVTVDIHAQAPSASLLCDEGSAFGVSFHAAPPKSRGLKEAVLSGAKVFFADLSPVPGTFYDLAFGVSPRSQRIWMVEAKLPVREGESWQQVSLRLKQELSGSGLNFPGFGPTPPITWVGTGEKVKVTLVAASSYVLVSCFHSENERLNVQEGLASLSGK